MGGEESIRRIWCQYRVRPNVVYLPSPHSCLSPAVEDATIRGDGDQVGVNMESSSSSSSRERIPSWCQSALGELPTYIVHAPPVEIQRQLLSAEMSTPYAAEFPFRPSQILPLSSALKMEDGPAPQDETHNNNNNNIDRSLTSPPSVQNISSMLVLVGLRIPSNVGMLIHAAEAMGFSCVTLVHCVDPFQEKVVRASRGSVFSPTVQLFEVPSDEQQDGRSVVSTLSTIAAQHRLLPLLAVPSQEEKPAFEVAKQFHAFNASPAASSRSLGPMLILGGESHGLRLLADGTAWSVPYKTLTLPIPNASIQSFNVGVAGCILMDLFRPGARSHFEDHRCAEKSTFLVDDGMTTSLKE